MNKPKTLAKNTIMLYIRMVLLIVVNLYTSRIVLNALGEKDYGLYAIVASVVIILSILYSSMTSASQRYLSFAKGKNELKEEIKIFSSLCISHLIVAIIIAIGAEIIGLYYIDNYLNVDSKRITAAIVVFQFSLLSLITKTITVPFTASIVANEKMETFALISLSEGGLQLTTAWLISHYNGDRLILYGFLMFLTVLICQISYILYTVRKFPECRISKSWDLHIVGDVFRFVSWNLLGAFSAVSMSQGVNLLLNFHFGVIINAARGISSQVSGALASFTNNFQQALNPQIVKCYALNNYASMHALVVNGARLSFFLLFVLCVPIMISLEEILTIWLVSVPNYTKELCYLELIFTLISSLSGTILTGVMSTGNIKHYQIIISLINFSVFPISAFALYYFRNPFLPSIIIIIMSIVALNVRLILARLIFGLHLISFLSSVLSSIMPVVAVSLGILFFLMPYFGNDNSLINVVYKTAAAFVITLSVIWCLGVKRDEKKIIYSMIAK